MRNLLFLSPVPFGAGVFGLSPPSDQCLSVCFSKTLFTPGLINKSEIYRNNRCQRERAPLFPRLRPWLLTGSAPGMKGVDPQIFGIQHNLFSASGAGRSISRQ